MLIYIEREKQQQQQQQVQYCYPLLVETRSISAKFEIPHVKITASISTYLL